MRHINKIGTQFELDGITQTKNFVDNCWCEETDKYINLIYERSRLKKLEEILVGEQMENGNSYCCYCMRKLFLGTKDGYRSNVTLEHIIPHRIKEEEWLANKDDYEKFQNLKSSHITICYRGELDADQKSNKINGIPYPHFISYHNLVASCDGTIMEEGRLKGSHCCNNNRQERFVLPIYLSKILVEGIDYDQEGCLDYDDNIYEERWFDNNHLNLTNSWITSVRKLWYIISKSEYTDLHIEEARSNKELRQNIIDDIDSANEIMSWVDNDNAWNLLSEYSWFYQYYKDKYSS